MILELVDLSQRADALAGWRDEGGFDDLERARAARFAHQGQARLFLAGRQWLRERLAQASGRAGIALAVGPHGKPYLDGGPHFSFSRSGPFAGVAICADGPIGFDLERIRPVEIAEPVVRTVARRMDTSGDGQSDGAMLRAFTMIEALTKRDGRPVRDLLDDPAGAEMVEAAAGAGLLVAVPAGPGLVAALAFTSATIPVKPVWRR